jgi:polysaccharide export outer membrane protein
MHRFGSQRDLARAKGASAPHYRKRARDCDTVYASGVEPYCRRPGQVKDIDMAAYRKLLPFVAVCLCWLLLITGVGASRAAEESDSSGLIQLGPGDSVKFEVYGQPDLTSTVSVGADGRLNLPLVGAVAVDGLSPGVAGTKIEQALKSGGFLNDPHVTVSVLNSRSQRISVLGQVHSPGRYTIDQKMTVLDVLAQAGGIGDDGADYVYVLHPDGAGSVHKLTVRLAGLAGAGGAPEDHLVLARLEGGDTLYVPRAERFYITGEVASGAMYRLEPGMTVLEAIARAGGVTQRGSQSRVEIKRPTQDGRYVTFHAKLTDKVQPDDVVRVKESIF